MRSYTYRGRRPIRDFRVVRPPEPSVPAPEPPPEPEPLPVFEAEPLPEPVLDYSSWLKADLVAYASALGVDASGTKADIIARLPNG